MALATAVDVGRRLGRDLTTAETARAEGLLEEAAVLVLAYLGVDEEPDPVPDAVKVVTSRMVARALLRDGTQDDAEVGAESVSQTTGPFARTLRFGSGTTSGGPWLAAADKAVLKRHRVGGGLATVAVSTGRTGNYRTGGL